MPVCSRARSNRCQVGQVDQPAKEFIDEQGRTRVTCRTCRRANAAAIQNYRNGVRIGRAAGNAPRPVETLKPGNPPRFADAGARTMYQAWLREQVAEVRRVTAEVDSR